MPDHVAVAAAPRAGRRSARGRARARLRALEPYLLLAPATIFLAVFFAWPALGALGLAFRTAAGEWTLAGVQRLIHDTDFGLAVRNTLLLLAVVIPLETAIALGMAVLARSRLLGHGLFVYAWSLPLVISDLAAGLVWFSIFTQHGSLNSVLQGLHLVRQPIGFLAYDNLAGILLAVVLAETWRSISLVMVILLSGIQGIPADLGEAAEMLGAGAWRRFRHVTLPLLKPSLQVALILRTTLGFQAFAVVVALAGSGFPVLGTQSYAWAAEYHDYQMGAVYAVLLLALSSLCTVFYLAVLRTPREVFGR